MRARLSVYAYHRITQHLILHSCPATHPENYCKIAQFGGVSHVPSGSTRHEYWFFRRTSGLRKHAKPVASMPSTLPLLPEAPFHLSYVFCPSHLRHKTDNPRAARKFEHRHRVNFLLSAVVTSRLLLEIRSWGSRIWKESAIVDCIRLYHWLYITFRYSNFYRTEASGRMHRSCIMVGISLLIRFSWFYDI